MAEDRAVAVKVEPANDPKQVLKMEVAVLRRMQGRPNTCMFYGCGRTANFNFLVMSLCGRNLSELRRDAPWGYFSQSTAIRLVMQTITAVEDLHSIGFLHRDIKPSNFAIGRSEEDKRTVFMLDFGLARQYVNTSGEHRAPRSAAGFRGTIRYASLAPHRNKEMSRIDDVWSLFYMLIEFLRGSLPWRRLRDRDQVKRMKERLGADSLIQDTPKELKDFLESITHTGYYDKPDYAFLSSTLQKIIAPQNVKMDDPFDWENGYKNCLSPPKQWATEKVSESDRKKAGGCSVPDISPVLCRLKPQSPSLPQRLIGTPPSKRRKAKPRIITSPSNSPVMLRVIYDN